MKNRRKKTETLAKKHLLEENALNTKIENEIKQIKKQQKIEIEMLNNVFRNKKVSLELQQINEKKFHQNEKFQKLKITSDAIREESKINIRAKNNLNSESKENHQTITTEIDIENISPEKTQENKEEKLEPIS